MTWIQVIDDAVKIGLGALIGGLFTWIVARHNNKSVIDKLQFERKTKMLSEVAETFEDYFQAYMKASTHYGFIAELWAKEPSIPETQKALYRDETERHISDAMRFRVEWAQKIANAVAAQSKLMLLGERQCLNKAEAFFNAINAAEAAFKFNGTSVNMSRYQETTIALRVAREGFYKEMERAFKS